MSKPNEELAALLNRMADVLQLLEANRFKVVAYQRAARTVEEQTQDLSELSESELKNLPGVGASMVEHIQEFLDTGSISEFEEHAAEIPAGVFELLEVPGLGPKTVAQFWKEANVTSVEELKAALLTGELETLPRMGKKKLEGIAKSLEFLESTGERKLIGSVLPLARWIVQQMSKLKSVQACEYAGSLRRGKETIGDIDVLIAADRADAANISKSFVSLDIVDDIIAQGNTKTSIRTGDSHGRLQVDLRIVAPESYGAAWMYFTGSKEHNVRLRERAIEQKWSLNEYGLWDESVKGEEARLVASRTESAIYEALNLQFIAPALREDRGEIKQAEADELPKLITLKDIQAELHAHTTASDGTWSIRDLAQTAARRGYHTVAVTDHSKSQVQANGLSEERLLKHIKEIHEVAQDMKDTIIILAGIEVDILSDGKLDYSDDILAQLDIVVASPHAALKQDENKATARLIKAIENPHVDIIGHPTGRLINRRPGLSPNMKDICAAAVEHDTALEINANSYRLDLRDVHAHAALDAGCKLSINTDAHGPDDLDQLIYGILTAQRAGATKGDIINAWSKTKLHDWLRHH